MTHRATTGIDYFRLERAAEVYLRYCYRNRTPARSSEFAAHVRVSLSYLSRLVPRIAGQSLLSYLRERQLLRAAELLQATPASLSIIAEGCAFGTVSTFHRAFRTRLGETPIDYRERCRAIRREERLELPRRPAPIERILSFDGDLLR